MTLVVFLLQQKYNPNFFVVPKIAEDILCTEDILFFVDPGHFLLFFVDPGHFYLCKILQWLK